jgi:hypothetical protein
MRVRNRQGMRNLTAAAFNIAQDSMVAYQKRNVLVALDRYQAHLMSWSAE